MRADDGACAETEVPRGRARIAPVFLTVKEVADLPRTTPKAIYAMVERGQLDGVTRIGRRVLIRWSDRLDWLDHKAAPSLKEPQ